MSELSPYEKCSEGPFHPFRDHETKYGWGIMHDNTGAVFALVGDKGSAFGLSAALNHQWDATQVFLKHTLEIPDSYMQRFVGTDSTLLSELVEALRIARSKIQILNAKIPEYEHQENTSFIDAALQKARGV